MAPFVVPDSRILILVLFTVSGACGLVYELVWMRLFASVLGSSLAATSVVLGTYMAGLALGGLGGARIDRARSALRAYGFVELAVGAYSLVLPLLARGTWSWAARPSAMLSCVVFLLIPTTLMGATLPAVVKALVPGRSPARAAAEAYAANLVGAVVGAFAGGILLLPRLGLSHTNMISALASSTVGAVALAVARRMDGAAEVLPPRTAPTAPMPLPALGVVVACGASMLALEIVWLRVIAAITEDTAIAQTATLVGFLLGLAAGGAVMSRFSDRVRSPWRLLAAVELAIGAYAFNSPAMLGWLSDHFGWRTLTDASVDRWFGGTASQLTLAIGFFLMPGALSAAALGLVFKICLPTPEALATKSGRVYALNAAGATIGALLAGSLAVPAVGSKGTILLAGTLALVAALTAFVAACRDERQRRLMSWPAWIGVAVSAGVVTAAVIVGALTGDRWALYGSTPRARVTAFAEEDHRGLVEVVEQRDGSRTLLIDRKHAWGSTDPGMLGPMLRQGYLPLLLHEAPRHVIEIGLGTGINFAPMLADPRVERAEIVEISPAVVDAAALFARENRDLLHHPKVKLFVEDGRHHLMASRDLYDVVILGLFVPNVAGASALFSEELYQACRQRLRPRGLVVHWLAIDQLTPAALRSVLTTFSHVFPEAHLWHRMQYVALVGANEPLAIDVAVLERTMREPAIAADLARAMLPDATSLLATYLTGPSGVAALAAGAPLNTDDRPTVEFSPLDMNLVGTHRQAANNLELLLSQRISARRILNQPPAGFVEALEVRSRAQEALLRGGIAEARGDEPAARAHFLRATQLDPRDEQARALAGDGPTP